MNSHQQGLSAEFLVCSDLCKQGYLAHMASAGGRYDVIVDVDNKLLRIQVKSTAQMIYEYGHKNPTYKFNLAKGVRSKLINPAEVDIVALVAVDCAGIAYLPAKECSTKTIKIRPAGAPLTAWQKKSNRIDELSFSKVLEELSKDEDTKQDTHQG